MALETSKSLGFYYPGWITFGGPDSRTVSYVCLMYLNKKDFCAHYQRGIDTSPAKE
jgi:hypothetical protein